MFTVSNPKKNQTFLLFVTFEKCAQCKVRTFYLHTLNHGWLHLKLPNHSEIYDRKANIRSSIHTKKKIKPIQKMYCYLLVAFKLWKFKRSGCILGSFFLFFIHALNSMVQIAFNRNILLVRALNRSLRKYSSIPNRW